MVFRRLYLTAFFILLAVSSRAQLPLDGKKYVDSLEAVLHSQADDSVKARTCFSLVSYLFSRDTAKTRIYLEQGKNLSKNYPYLTALSHVSEGFLYFNTDAGKARTALLKADSLLGRFKTREAYLVRANLWNNLGVLQQRDDDDRAYIDITLNKTIPFAKQAGDSATIGTQFLGVGLAFMNLEQYDKAEGYLNTAIRILRRPFAQPSRLVSAYNRAGENYIYLKKYALAKSVLDSVKILLEPHPESELYSGYYLTEGMYYHALKQYKKAVGSFDKGIAAADGPNRDYVIMEHSFLKIKSLIATEEYKQAQVLLTELSGWEDLMSMDVDRLEVYQGLAATYAGMGNMNQAYTWMKRSHELNDSLYKSRLIQDVNALEIKYKNAEHEKEILALRAKNEQAVLSAKNSRLGNWLLASASALLLVIVVFFLLHLKNSKKLASQKEINYQQQLKEIRQQQQLSSIKAMMDGEERERKRIARDLHDGLGGLLAGVKMDISKIGGHLKAEEKILEQLQAATGQLDDSINELRYIAQNMMPETLLKFGLVSALKDFCESVENESTHIVLQCYGIDNQSLRSTVQIMMYRIVQELVTNAIKHAGASNVLVDCLQDEQQISITVEDNGKGFDPAGARRGMGLNNVQARVNYLNGKLDIQSAENTGTTVIIQFNEDELKTTDNAFNRG